MTELSLLSESGRSDERTVTPDVNKVARSCMEKDTVWGKWLSFW